MEFDKLTNFPIGSLWKRASIHDILGGQRQGGISTPSRKPYIILFSSPRGEEYGYKDGWKDDGFFYYTGEGQEGPMKFERGNKAIRDHSQDGKVLLLFETERNGRRRFIGPMVYAGHSDLWIRGTGHWKPLKRLQIVQRHLRSAGGVAR